MSDQVLKFVVQQAPIVAFLALVLWFVYKETSKSISRKDEIIDRKDKQLISLSEKALKVASLWDVKSDLNSKEHEEITTVLGEMRDDIKGIKTQIKR